MEVQLTNEQTAELSRLAARSGKDTGDLLRDLVDRYIAEEAHFASAVHEGLVAAERNDFVPTNEVWAAVEHELKA